MDSIEAWLDSSLSHFINHKEAIALDLLIQPCILKMMSQTPSLKLAVPSFHQLLLTLFAILLLEVKLYASVQLANKES